MVRQGYRRLLALESDLVVCGEADSADAACQAVVETTPDVVVLDLNLGASSGLEALRRMRLRNPGLRVLVFSMYDGPTHVTQALRAGAQAYLTKSTPPQDMVGAIRRMVRGERVLSPDVAHAMALEQVDSENLLSRLTPREFEVLRLTVRGDPVSTVADHLHLSAKTVFNNLSSIRNKLQVGSDFQLLQLAARHGIVEIPVARDN